MIKFKYIVMSKLKLKILNKPLSMTAEQARSSLGPGPRVILSTNEKAGALLSNQLGQRFLIHTDTYTTGRNEIQRCVFRFRTFNLNPSWILSQLSYERVLYIKSFVYASLFDCKNKIGKICTVRETINRTTR